MIDIYNHESMVIYSEENILGPSEHSPEYKQLVEDFNSQLTAHCDCSEECLQPLCNCLQKLNDRCTNYYKIYNIHTTKYRLENSLLLDEFSEPVIECNELCSCNKNCGNRVVQYGPIDSLSVRISNVEAKGKGLFTSKLITKGTFICEYAGEVITKSEANLRHKLNAINKDMNYILCLNEYCSGKVTQTIVDPKFVGNIGRYINHSCEPNSVIIPVRVNSPIPRLAVFSNIDIQANTEITFDYGPHQKSSSNCALQTKCLCGSKSCRGMIPFENY